MTGPEYLARLPAHLRTPGDCGKGEIEIVTDPESLQKIREQGDDVARAGAPGSNHGSGSGREEIGIVFEDEYLLLVRDPVRFPSGQLGTYLRVVERAGLTGSLGVVALPERNGAILLRENFRHANRRWELEAPRGTREPQHTVEETLELEIAQELGLPILSRHHLGVIAANSGMLAGDTDLFLVRVGDEPENDAPEPTEALGRIVELTVPELVGRIAAGEIRDAYTLSAVLRALSLGYLTL